MSSKSAMAMIKTEDLKAENARSDRRDRSHCCVLPIAEFSFLESGQSTFLAASHDIVGDHCICCPNRDHSR